MANRDHNIDYHQFDVHLSHACNFTCESCSHYSNFNFTGNLELETAESWYRTWKGKLEPFRINLLGGEPAINPKMAEHIMLARKYWPKAALFLYTNGLLLHRHKDLPRIIQNVGGKFEFRLSIHYDSPEYLEKSNKVLELLEQWKVEYGLSYAVSESFSRWTRRYFNENGILSPFHDDDQKASWENCNAKWCLQLHEGKLWKCPIIAYLPMMDEKYRLSPEWEPYLAYKPLEADCSESELREFLARKDEFVCTACPAYKRHFPKNDPMKPGTRLLRRTTSKEQENAT